MSPETVQRPDGQTAASTPQVRGRSLLPASGFLQPPGFLAACRPRPRPGSSCPFLRAPGFSLLPPTPNTERLGDAASSLRRTPTARGPGGRGSGQAQVWPPGSVPSDAHFPSHQTLAVPCPITDNIYFFILIFTLLYFQEGLQQLCLFSGCKVTGQISHPVHLLNESSLPPQWVSLAPSLRCF